MDMVDRYTMSHNIQRSCKSVGSPGPTRNWITGGDYWQILVCWWRWWWWRSDNTPSAASGKVSGSWNGSAAMVVDHGLVQVVEHLEIIQVHPWKANTGLVEVVVVL